MPHVDERLKSLPEPGEVFMGKYRIARLIGMGGMGAVLEAEHMQLGERVAIKFLLGGHLRPDRAERFAREAWVAAKIRSDHIARVMDVGTSSRGDQFMVMEFLDGEDLLHVVRRGPLPVATAVDYILQAAEPLAEAHRLEIIHRDLKPANMFVTRRADGVEQIKLLDFGISKFAASSLSLTKTSALLGSPLYMAPEQLTSTKTVDARADIWALGVILFQLVSGELPFPGDSLPEICTRVLYEAPRKLREVAPAVAPALEAVVMRALHKKRDQRYSDLLALAEALLPHGSEAAKQSLAYVRGVFRMSSMPSIPDIHEAAPPPAPDPPPAAAHALPPEDDAPITSDVTTDRLGHADGAADEAPTQGFDITSPVNTEPEPPPEKPSLKGLLQTLRSSGPAPQPEDPDDLPTRRISPQQVAGEVAAALRTSARDLTTPLMPTRPLPPRPPAGLTSTVIMSEAQAPEVPEAGAVTAEGVWRPPPPAPRSGNGAKILVAAASLCLLGGGTVAVWLGSQPDGARSAAAAAPAVTEPQGPLASSADPPAVGAANTAVETKPEPKPSASAPGGSVSAPGPTSRPLIPKTPRPKPSSLLDKQF